MTGSFSSPHEESSPTSVQEGDTLDLFTSCDSSLLSLSWCIDSHNGLPIMPADCHPRGTSVLVQSIIPYLSPVVPCSPFPPPGNNGVHGSAVSANTPSIMTLCCAILSALTQHVICQCYYGQCKRLTHRSSLQHCLRVFSNAKHREHT